MNAVVIEKPGKVVVKEIPDPVPAPFEVLLYPKTGGICGTDVHIFEGDFIGNYPVIPCHEFSAEVVGLGREVKGLRVGDAVAVDPNIRCGRCRWCKDGEINLCEKYDAVGVTRPGGFAELVCVPAKNVYKLGNDCYSSTAFSEPLACVLYGHGHLHFVPESDVIIWGAGAIGLLHMQMCKLYHRARVTIVDKDPKRVKIAKKLGYGEVFLSDDTMDQRLMQLRPDGWDIAIDATGNVAAVGQMLGHLRRGGQALIFGVYPRKDLLQLSLFDVFLNDWRIYGSFTYRHEFSRAVEILSSGTINTSLLIDEIIDLKGVPDVLRHLSEGESLGKVQVKL